MSLTDTEGRTAAVAARIGVASRLTVATAVLRPARVSKVYGAKLTTSGGVKPFVWKITAGKLPRGVRFDRVLGSLSGVPTKAGRYRLSFEALDSLRVAARKTLTLIVTGT